MRASEHFILSVMFEIKTILANPLLFKKIIKHNLVVVAITSKKAANI